MSLAMTEPVAQLRLFAGPVDATFVPGSDQVLGAWCFAGAALPDLDGDSPLPDEPFDHPDEVVADFKMICALANTMLDEFVVTLNARHGVDYDKRFWRIALMPGLIDILSLAWYRYREVMRFLDRPGEAPVHVLACRTEMEIDLRDYRDVFATTHGDPDYSAWVAAVILDGVAGDDARDITIERMVTPAGPIRRTAAKAVQKTTLQSVRDALRSRYFAIGTLANEFSLGLKVRSIIAEMTLAALLRFKPRRSSPDWPAVEPYNGPQPPQTFIDAARKIVAASLPSSVTSRFEELDRAARLHRYKPGRVRVLTSAFMFDDAQSMEVAHGVLAGEVLVAMQHGGPTGVMAAMQLSPETEFRFHRYITWGWSSHPNYPGQFLALPSPQLSGLARARRDPNGPIIFVSSCVRLLAGRLSFEGDIFNRNYAHREKFSFFAGLDEIARNKIAYRPYPAQPSSIPDAEIMRDRYPDMPVVGGNFHDALMGARAVVMESPGSTFYQAMAANIPVIAYWNEDAFHMTPEAKRIFDKFRAAGFVYGGGAAAANHLALVIDDIEGWWQQPEIQSAREEFCETYARVSRFWWVDWIKALWRL